jgi:hypothetical protein
MLREEGGWQSHLENTRAAILAAVDRLNPKTVRVLGSGWLLDVPLKELSERCERITLCDIIHPRQIVSKYAGSGTITFETVDLTGGLADKVYYQRKREFDFDRFMEEVRGIRPWVYPEDLIVSANLLSQLSVFLADYLADKVKIGGDGLIEFTRVVQQHHLDSLPVGRSVLVADYEEEYRDEDGNLIGVKPTVHVDLPRQNVTGEWDWVFDTKMFYRDDCETILKVVAVEL